MDFIGSLMEAAIKLVIVSAATLLLIFVGFPLMTFLIFQGLAVAAETAGDAAQWLITLF